MASLAARLALLAVLLPAAYLAWKSPQLAYGTAQHHLTQVGQYIQQHAPGQVQAP